MSERTFEDLHPVPFSSRVEAGSTALLRSQWGESNQVHNRLGDVRVELLCFDPIYGGHNGFNRVTLMAFLIGREFVQQALHVRSDCEGDHWSAESGLCVSAGLRWLVPERPMLRTSQTWELRVLNHTGAVISFTGALWVRAAPGHA